MPLDISRPGLSGADARTVEVVFHADAGATYVIRLGADGRGEAGEVGLRWEDAAPPVWLRYIGRLAPRGPDADGNALELELAGKLAFNGDGRILFFGTGSGMQVFRRNADNGLLTLAQPPRPEIASRSQLIWDRHRERLWVAQTNGCHWSQFLRTSTAEDSGWERRELPERVRHSCGSGHVDLAMDPAGESLYVSDSERHKLEAFAIEGSEALRRVQSLDYSTPTGIELNRAGSHAYALANGSLHAFERDADTGELAEVHEQYLGESTGLVISDDSAHLFVVQDNPPQVTVFGLAENPEIPRRLASLNNSWGLRCHGAFARRGAAAADFVCEGPSWSFGGGAFTARWQPETEVLSIPDTVSGVDRFNNPVPEFLVVRGSAASPDGRHVYVATAEQGLLIFERVGNAPGDGASSR